MARVGKPGEWKSLTARRVHAGDAAAGVGVDGACQLDKAVALLFQELCLAGHRGQSWGNGCGGGWQECTGKHRMTSPESQSREGCRESG
jgi:hypothetical protein